MSKSSLEWYELPPSRWQEMSSVREGERSYRDSQREKEYTAESKFNRKFFGESKQGVFRHEHVFSSIEEVREYVYKLIGSAWLKRRWKLEKVPKIELITKAGFAYVQYGNIFLGQRALKQTTVLHELAHVLAPSKYGTPHGRFFARTLLELVGHELGDEARKCLKKQFSICGVKSNPKPQYSKEGLEKMKQNGKRLKQTTSLYRKVN